MAKQPAIQGISSPSRGDSFEGNRYSMGEAYTVFVSAASGGFYTTKVSNLKISATTYTAPTDHTSTGTLVFEFSGSPDLSEVMVKNVLRVSVCEDLANTGDFEIISVDDSADTITVKARAGTTNASSSGSAETMPFFGGYSLYCLSDTSGLSVSSDDDAGALVPDLTAGIGILGTFTEVTISTSGVVEVKVL